MICAKFQSFWENFSTDQSIHYLEYSNGFTNFMLATALGIYLVFCAMPFISIPILRCFISKDASDNEIMKPKVQTLRADLIGTKSPRLSQDIQIVRVDMNDTKSQRSEVRVDRATSPLVS